MSTVEKYSAFYLTLTLENIAVKYTSANLSSLKYYVRFRKCISVGNQLSNSMQWMPLNYVLHSTAVSITSVCYVCVTMPMKISILPLLALQKTQNSETTNAVVPCRAMTNGKS